MPVSDFLGRKRGRKYPVRRDSQGIFRRSRCFVMFVNQVPLAKIASAVDVKLDTVRKYYQQWSQNPDINKEADFYKSILREGAPDRDHSLEVIARGLGISKEELETLLHQPYGLKRLPSGKIYLPAQAKMAHHKALALELAYVISDHIIKEGGSFEDVYYAFERWMCQNQFRREEIDAEVQEDNDYIIFLRRIIKAEAEMERRGEYSLTSLPKKTWKSPENGDSSKPPGKWSSCTYGE